MKSPRKGFTRKQEKSTRRRQEIAFGVGVILASFFTVLIVQKGMPLSIFEIFGSSSTAQYHPAADSVVAAANGMRVLGTNEFALVKEKVSGMSAHPKMTQGVLSIGGNPYSFTAEEGTAVNAITGSDGQTTFVSNPHVEIHNVNESGLGGIEKIDPDLAQNLNSKAVAPAIIQLNIPVKNFYSRKRVQSRINELHEIAAAQAAFDDAKQKVRGDLKGKSKLKRDLKVIAGVSADVDKASLDALAKDPLVKKVEIDEPVQATLDTSLDEINAKSVWPLFDASNNPLTGVGRRIAIIDTGVDYHHPDLGGCLGPSCKVIGGYDFVNNDADPMDDMGHGTHVAATAAGKGLLNGVAPDAQILAYKVLNSGGSGYASAIIAAIDRAVDPNQDGSPADHADVISMSLGGGGNPDDSMSLAVDRASAAGVVSVIAAGNSGPTASTIGSPGTARTAITVAAACKAAQIGVDSYCQNPIAGFSSRGPLVWNGVDIKKPDIAAPGRLICAARWDSSFASSPTCFDSSHVRISGTSMATPHMAGAAALVLQANPSYTPDQVRQLLKGTAKDLGMGYDAQGAGEVDLHAAIPGSSVLVSTPGIWNVTSDPKTKLSTSNQIFSITSKDSAISTLSVSFQIDVPGVTGSTNKAQLDVSGKTTDSFTATLAIDNDVAKAGRYMERIVLTENGQTKGIIPILLTVQQTFSLSPSQSSTLDYGTDDPRLSVWTSEKKHVTVTNLRLDGAQTIAFNPPVMGPGVTMQLSDSSISVPAGGSAAVDAWLIVDNSVASNGLFADKLSISNTSSSVSLAVTFKKFFVLDVKDVGGTSMWIVLVRDRSTNKLFVQVPYGPEAPFYLNAPGPYDVMIMYFSGYTGGGNRYSQYFVSKDNITITGGSATVLTSKSDAKNEFKIVPTDANGNRGGPLSYSLFGFQYVPDHSNVFMICFMWGQGMDLSTHYFSDFSTNYIAKGVFSVVSGSRFYDYFGTFTGMTDSRQFTNVPADFKKIDLQFDGDAQTGSETMSLLSLLAPKGLGGGFFLYNTLNVPVRQTLYSLSPETVYQYKESYRTSGGLNPWFALSPPFTTAARFYYYWQNQELPKFLENGIYDGLGPSYWQVWLQKNGGQVIDFYPYFLIRPLTNPGLAAFLRQDYSVKRYEPFPYSLYKDGVKVSSGTFPEYDGSTYNFFLGSAVVPGLGKYELRVDFPYKNLGLDMTGKVRETFDTSLDDSSPPAIKRLYYYNDEKRAEYYDPTASNRVEAELDPIGGSLGDVSFTYSTDGTTFTPLTTNASDGVYRADVPENLSADTLTLNLTAADSSGNILSYSFDLPVHAGPVQPPIVTVSISPASATILTAQSQQYTATVQCDSNPCSQAVTWSSSNSQVATVDTAGNVVAKSAGTTTVTATSVQDPTKSDRAALTVVNCLPDATVTISPSVATKLRTQTQQYAATVTGCSSANATWSTSNTSVASVDATGKVTALAAGTATITATSALDSTRKATATMTVARCLPTASIAVTPSSLTVAVSQTGSAFTATVTDCDSTGVTWSVTPSGIATVDSSGVVRGVAAGSATVTASAVSDPSVKKDIPVVVTSCLSNAIVTPSAVSTLFVGQIKRLTASVTGCANTNVTWSSSNTAVATVDATGKVTARAAGTVIITATSIQDPSVSGTVVIAVIGCLPDATVSITPGTAARAVGETQRFNVTVTGCASSAVTWTSSDETVAVISGDGLAVGMQPGTVTITATSRDDSSKQGTAQFTVRSNAATLTVTKSGDSSGTVVSSSNGINCGTDCSETFKLGTTITLSARREKYSKLSAWSGACSGTGSCRIVMDSDKQVDARFDSTDTLSPAVSIASPVNNSTVKSGIITIIARASDASGIQEITLLVDGTEVKSCTARTNCNYNWNTRSISAGTHTIVAHAIDNADNAADATVTVTKR